MFGDTVTIKWYEFFIWLVGCFGFGAVLGHFIGITDYINDRKPNGFFYHSTVPSKLRTWILTRTTKRISKKELLDKLEALEAKNES